MEVMLICACINVCCIVARGPVATGAAYTADICPAAPIKASDTVLNFTIIEIAYRKKMIQSFQDQRRLLILPHSRKNLGNLPFEDKVPFWA
jgi:hypothetical protein